MSVRCHPPVSTPMVQEHTEHPACELDAGVQTVYLRIVQQMLFTIESFLKAHVIHNLKYN